MFQSFTSHQPSQANTSCAMLINYLEKENKIPNEDNLIFKENFFDSNFNANNTEQEITAQKVISDIDKNRGSQKLSSSNFYMLNIAPSPKELKHMENIAEKTLKERNILKDNALPASQIFYNEQKDQLMKMQLKFYVKDVMCEYANNFNREIYNDENKLPNIQQHKILEKETEIIYNNYLLEKKIIVDKIENTKIENDKYLQYNNCVILSDKGKFKELEITISDGKKAIVNVPSKSVFLQKDNSIKMLESVYIEKSKEVLLKNTMKEIEYKFIKTDNIIIDKKEVKIFNFAIKDERFKEPLKFSVQEKDLIKRDNKYFISEHLHNEKVKYAIDKNVNLEFGDKKKTIYTDLATKKGFDLSTRPLTEKDLMWYAKIEKNRTYKHSDPSVQHNIRINKQIEKLNKNPIINTFKIKDLEKQLITDQDTKMIIKEGNVKGGLNYHTHIIISRHDKTMKEPRNKQSLSPNANHKTGEMNNGAKVGFDRTKFAAKIEKIFDEKFEYNRPIKEQFNTLNNNKALNKAKGMTRNKAKQFISKHTGLNEAKKELAVAEPLINGLIKNKNIVPGIINKIKQDIGLSKIPTQLPKSVVDLAITVVKKVLSKGIEF